MFFSFATNTQIISRVCLFCLRNACCICPLLLISSAIPLVQSTVILPHSWSTGLPSSISRPLVLHTATWLIFLWIMSDLIWTSLMTPYHLLDQIQDPHLGLQFLKNWLLHTCRTSFYSPLLPSCCPPGILMSVLFFSFLVFVYCYCICPEYPPLLFPGLALSHSLVLASLPQRSLLTALFNHHTNTYPPLHLIAAACFFPSESSLQVLKVYFFNFMYLAS